MSRSISASYSRRLDNMFLIRVGVVLPKGEVMAAAQDHGRFADGGQLAEHRLQRGIGIVERRAYADIPDIGQLDIRVPVILLIELFTDGIRAAGVPKIAADPPLFFTADEHQIRVIYIGESLVVSIDQLPDLSVPYIPGPATVEPG